MKTFVTFALVVILAGSACAANFVVLQNSLTFTPDDLTINVGDTVEWIHQSGFHTVTNGTGAADPLAGSMFDASLSSGSFSFTFNASGDIPYFCRPHEGFGMAGVIRVENQVGAEAESFGNVKRLFR
jgi:plastocyanin